MTADDQSQQIDGLGAGRREGEWITMAAVPDISLQATGVHADRVEGPLKGYHHQTYAVRLEQTSPLAREFPWLKLREPRPGVLWYDMRWFVSEHAVLRLLFEQTGPPPPRIPRVGEIHLGDEKRVFMGFIEGVTLDRIRGEGDGRLPDGIIGQMAEVLGWLGTLSPGPFERRARQPVCDHDAGPWWTDSSGQGSTEFLRRLTHFTMTHVYEQQRPLLDALLRRLGVPQDALPAFVRHPPLLTDRPRTVLHGDLHRKNLIVDRAGLLWTIDWELALIGDPLYDLATLLHLMGLHPDQEQDLINRWEDQVGPERSAGVREDLPHYMAYKRVQSVCTDVLRAASRLAESWEVPGTPAGDRRVRGAAAAVRKALLAAREHLGLPDTPKFEAVEAVYQDWWREHSG